MWTWNREQPACKPAEPSPAQQEREPCSSRSFLLVPKPRPVQGSALVPPLPRGHLQDLQQWSRALDGKSKQLTLVFQAPELRDSGEGTEAS